MTVVVPQHSPFAKKQIKRLTNFALGLNNKVSTLLLDDKEVAQIQNFHYDEKGALTKRKGYTKHYASSFDGSPARDMVNYRKQDGTSRIVIAAADKLYYDKPQFVQLFDAEADWETVGVAMSNVNSTTTAGDITLDSSVLGMLGAIMLGAVSAMLGAPGTLSMTRSGTWTSQPIDLTAVADKTSGVCTVAQTVPASTTITVETRTSADGSTGWSAYVGLGASSTIVSAANNFLQIRVTMTSTVAANPSVQSLQVTYDTTATVLVLASTLSTLARYTFATQNDNLYITNGANVMSKWDGTTYSATSPGSPPTAKYVFVHKNIMFLAGNTTNPSRLYFSALADPESWPALNFVDVGKGDGDQITGLAVLLDRLVVFKNNSIYLLEGDSSTTFVLRRATDEAGCVDQHSIVVVKNTLGFLARDGFYFFDGVRAALASEKIVNTFTALNSSQLGLVSAIHFPAIRKVFISVPSEDVLYNDTVLVFDTLYAAWTVYSGINAASWVIWRQFNTDHLLFGGATIGQVYDAETGYSDDGNAISCYAVTKGLDLGALEIAKFTTECFIVAKETTETGDATINVSFFRDLMTTETTTTAATITSTEANVRRAVPSAVGAGSVRDLAVKIAESSSTRSVTVYAITLEFTPRLGLRATT